MRRTARRDSQCFLCPWRIENRLQSFTLCQIHRCSSSLVLQICIVFFKQKHSNKGFFDVSSLTHLYHYPDNACYEQNMTNKYSGMWWKVLRRNPCWAFANQSLDSLDLGGGNCYVQRSLSLCIHEMLIFPHCTIVYQHLNHLQDAKNTVMPRLPLHKGVTKTSL